MGDAIGANAFLLGFAYQKGLMPLAESSLSRAIELNGAAVEMNKSAFSWGRAGCGRSERVCSRPKTVTSAVVEKTLDEMIAYRAEYLTQVSEPRLFGSLSRRRRARPRRRR